MKILNLIKKFFWELLVGIGLFILLLLSSSKSHRIQGLEAQIRKNRVQDKLLEVESSVIGQNSTVNTVRRRLAQVNKDLTKLEEKLSNEEISTLARRYTRLVSMLYRHRPD